MAEEKGKNNDVHNTGQKTNYRAPRTPLIIGG